MWYDTESMSIAMHILRPKGRKTLWPPVICIVPHLKLMLMLTRTGTTLAHGKDNGMAITHRSVRNSSKSGCDSASDAGAAHRTEGSRCHDVSGTALAGTLQVPHIIRGSFIDTLMPAGAACDENDPQDLFGGMQHKTASCDGRTPWRCMHA